MSYASVVVHLSCIKLIWEKLKQPNNTIYDGLNALLNFVKTVKHLSNMWRCDGRIMPQLGTVWCVIESMYSQFCVVFL